MLGKSQATSQSIFHLSSSSGHLSIYFSVGYSRINVAVNLPSTGFAAEPVQVRDVTVFTLAF